MSNDEVYDVLVLGLGPAGAAAALFAAKRGLKVAGLDRGNRIPDDRCVEWLNPAAHELLNAAGLESRRAVLGRIGPVTFMDPRNDKTASVDLGETVHLVSTSRLIRDLVDAASVAGAVIEPRKNITMIDVREHEVLLQDDKGSEWRGRVLMAADGCDSQAVRALGFSVDPGGLVKSRCCEWIDGTLPDKKAGAKDLEAALTVVLLSDDLERYGYVLELGNLRVVGLVSSASSEALPGMLTEAATRWQQKGLLPEGAAVSCDDARVRPVPRGLALDYDFHVAKRLLLIGDAGGFVSAASHEGLYPAIWSARLAVDICVDAFLAGQFQDSLGAFDTRWRGEMVEYLRSPNADLRFLIPLAFSNERMAQKLAAGLLAGRNV